MDMGQIRLIANAYDLAVPDEMPAPWVGATSRVYPLNDVVLKVALDTPDAARSVAIDAAMNLVARNLGVRAPELLAFVNTRALLPVPFTIFRRVPDARPLADLPKDDPAAANAWREVGKDLALVHGVPYGTAMPVSLREFRQSPEVDPRVWVDELGARGVLPGDDAVWLRDALEAVAPDALAGIPLHLCHGDVNASNILVDASTGGYRALIDWAGAGWLDPVWDFAGVPLPVVPWLLEGHRAVAPLPHDETTEARIFWCQTQTRLHAALSHDGPDPLTSDLAALRLFANANACA